MKIKILLLLLFVSFSVQAQDKPNYKDMMHDNSVNFYTVCQAAEKYFDTIDKTKKGSGWKQYQRWRVNNEYKYYPDGNRSNVDPEFVQKNFALFNNQYGNTNNKLFQNGWEELGPLTIDSISGHYSAGLGRIEDFYVAASDTNRIYLGSRSGGFWKSTNGGATWTGGSTDFLAASGVNAITASPTNPDSILINVRNSRNGYSHGVYRSTDGGSTFTLSNFNPTTTGKGGLGSSFAINKIAYHPRVPNLIFVLTNQGIYRSTDNLQTWSILYSSNTITQIDFHPVNDNIIYIYNYSSPNRNNIFISTDQGISFTASATIASNSNSKGHISTSNNCNDCVYFASSNGVWRSLDTGQNFTFLYNPNESCQGFAVNDLDTTELIYGYLDLEASTDGGQSFNQVTSWSLGNTNGAGSGNQTSYFNSTDYVHADLRNAKCINGTFYVATDGFLCKSSNGGTTWQILSDGVGIRENYSLGISQSNHYRTVCGSQDNGTSIKLESGWLEFYGADGMEAIIHPLNPDWMLASIQYGSRRITKDAGQTQGGATPSGSSNAYWVAPLAYDPNNPMTVYDFRDVVYKSMDFASNYSIVGSPASFTGDITEAAIAENNSDIIIIARNQYIDKSTDGGANFSSIKNNLPNYSIEDIAFDPTDDNTIIVVYGRYQNDNSKVFITTNGGTSWTNITYNLGNMPIRSVVIDHTIDRNIYLGAEIGVYTKPMSATSWSLHNADLPNTSILEMEINHGSNTLKAATWGRGLWEYSLVGRSTYPAILKTDITNPPTESTPKESIDQYVTSLISYDNTLTAVYLEWSTNTIVLGNFISMNNVSDSTWVSSTPLPDVAAGTKMHFKVFAVGSNNDTTETYRFMYTQKPFEYCNASGSTSSGNLFIDNVTLLSINNSTGNDTYTLYQNPIPTLFTDSTYSIAVSGNTGWSSNDYGAWIDFNNDSEFSANEQILLSVGSGSSATGSFTVPSFININDTVRLRVRLSYWGNAPSPCGTTFGEVEDYLILLSTNKTAPAAPTVSVSHPNCDSAMGLISISAPLGNGLEYSNDGINFQSSPNFMAPPGTYNVTVRDSIYHSLVSPATTQTINSTTIPCGPNIAVGAQSLPSSIAEGGTSNINYFISNVGTEPSSGAINILISKPTNGTVTFNLPTGWTILTNTVGSTFLQTSNIIQPGLTNRETIPASYTHDNTNEDAVKNTNIKVSQGSGNEVITNDNEGQTFIQIN